MGPSLTRSGAPAQMPRLAHKHCASDGYVPNRRAQPQAEVERDTMQTQDFAGALRGTAAASSASPELNATTARVDRPMSGEVQKPSNHTRPKCSVGPPSTHPSARPLAPPRFEPGRAPRAGWTHAGTRQWRPHWTNAGQPTSCHQDGTPRRNSNTLPHVGKYVRIWESITSVEAQCSVTTAHATYVRCREGIACGGLRHGPPHDIRERWTDSKHGSNPPCQVTGPGFVIWFFFDHDSVRTDST